MKNIHLPLLMLLLVLPSMKLWSQYGRQTDLLSQAFFIQNTKEDFLAWMENDLDSLYDANNQLFFYGEFDGTLAFINDPFGFEGEVDIRPMRALAHAIRRMTDIKEAIPREFYPLLRKVRDIRPEYVFPASYDEFISNPAIILEAGATEPFLMMLEEKSVRALEEIIFEWESVEPPFEYVGLMTAGDDHEGTKSDGPPPPPAGVIPPSEKGGLGDLLSSVSGLATPTAIIDATAQFLVERTKEELVIAFFDKFQNRIDSIVELRYLFSNTYSLLRHRDVFQIPSLGEGWKYAFEKDLREIPLSFNRMIDETGEYAFLSDQTAYKLFQLSYQLVSKEERSVSQLIGLLSASNLSSSSTYLDSTFATLKSVTNDLAYFDDYKGFVRRSQKLNDTGKEYMVALQYQKNQSFYTELIFPSGFPQNQTELQQDVTAYFNSEVRVCDMMGNVQELIESFQDHKGDQLEGVAKEDQQKKLKEIIPQKTEEANSLLKKLLKAAFMLRYWFDEPAFYNNKYYLQALELLQVSNDFVDAMYGEDPAQIFVSSLKAIDPILRLAEEHQFRRVAKLNQQLQGTGDQEIKKVIKARIENNVSRLNQIRTVSNYMGYYGGFCLDVMNSNSSQAIKVALYRYALPAGSYKLKRESTRAVELGAFPGLYAAGEILRDSLGTGFQLVNGVTAPIGLSITGAIGSKEEIGEGGYAYVLGKNRVMTKRLTGWTYGIFIPIIDIGAPFSYRWTQGNAGGLPEEITWRQVFSPGAYAILGMKNNPITFSLGVQYSPQLRSISEAGNEVELSDAFRIGGGINVDIPIFRFFSK